MSVKDWSEKDYYKILGVSKNATQDEIKKAFRKLARENHPDQHPNDKKAEARFKEASEANAVLSDPAQRKKYDQQRAMMGAGNFFSQRAGNFEDIFKGAKSGSGPIGGFGDLLGNLGNLFGDGGARRPKYATARRGADVETEVTIDFEKSIKGATVTLPLVSESPCASCRGTGAKSGSVPNVCPNCQGSGMGAGLAGAGVACANCHGRGLIVDDPCTGCGGSGRAKSKKTVTVGIPAGVDDGQKIRLKGKGSPGENGGVSGDLIILVHVSPHPIFARSGVDITLTVPVTYAEAALGSEIKVPTLSGAVVTMKIPAGAANGRKMRIPGRGIARKDGTKGSQIVTLEVVVPDKLSEQAKQALQTYADLAAEPDPRAKLLGV